ncbi:MAG: glutamate--cysteine ligase [Pseudomonadales bacterium]|nr:glutamate--cysteine ligase [Pseudomonadales bacterium]
MTATSLQRRTDLITASLNDWELNKIRRGIEKESLRILPDGHLAQTPHPQSLGAALTHPSITTDYSEALLEFITPAFTEVEQPLEYLKSIHRYVYQNIDGEKLWVNSMPCIMGGDESIPIAQYGNSNIGKMKTVYRHGLWHRYGRLMQSIAGIHYNFSVPSAFWEQLYIAEGPGVAKKENSSLQDFTSAGYFSLIRNFQRYSWLPIYLFGASPAVCASFLRGRDHKLQTFNGHTLYSPYATSLRMSDLGYQNSAQSNLKICYNDLPSYVTSLGKAMGTPYPPYQKLGIKKEGEYMQLNSNTLQIENEYYGTIRPKRTADSGESPSQALKSRGVEYIEMRCIDLDPFSPIGISETQARFLDLFALHCLLEDSPLIDDKEQKDVSDNQRKIVLSGRNTKQSLTIRHKTNSIKNWADELLDQMSLTAELLDKAQSTQQYSSALKTQRLKVADPNTTPSAIILNTLFDGNLSFYEFAMSKALEHENYFKRDHIGDETKGDPLIPSNGDFVTMSHDSIKKQKMIEDADTVTFDQFLADYFRD